MLPRAMMALAMLLATAGCTVTTEPTTTTVAAHPAASPGRLVVLDDTGNVVTMDPDGSNPIELTDDEESPVRRFQPIWAPSERRVAWGVVDSSGFGVVLTGDDGDEPVRIPVTGFPFYLNWAPDASQIGVLHNRVDGGPGLEFELVDVEMQVASVVDTGAPYYFSWSPDADAIVVHADGDRLEILDDSADPMDIGPTSADYLSPRWTRAGIFYLRDDGVVLRDDGGATRVLLAADGFVSVNPSPLGDRVAVHSLTADGGITVGLDPVAQSLQPGVSVVDVASGDVETVVDGLSVGSFWSPDGERLLVLVVDESNEAVQVVVWEEGTSTTLATMSVPPSLVTEALAFFDQYAQSWNVWSPGSDAVVLPGTIDGDPGVWVLPVQGEPVRVARGQWAAWSHG